MISQLEPKRVGGGKELLGRGRYADSVAKKSGGGFAAGRALVIRGEHAQKIFQGLSRRVVEGERKQLFIRVDIRNVHVRYVPKRFVYLFFRRVCGGLGRALLGWERGRRSDLRFLLGAGGLAAYRLVPLKSIVVGRAEALAGNREREGER